MADDVAISEGEDVIFTWVVTDEDGAQPGDDPALPQRRRP